MSNGKIDCVVGGQFGSEAKGHLTAQLAKRAIEDVLAVRVNGPNAGHTVVGQDDRVWKLRQIPTPAVSDPGCKLAIAAGSEIDPEVLLTEIRDLDAAGYRVSDRLLVDPTATLITPEHRRREQTLVTDIGSTGKGIGAARADRIMRMATLAYDLRDQVQLWDVSAQIRGHLGLGGRVILEGTQGYGLGLHAGFYPHCTSSDCTAIDTLAAARVSPWTVKGPPLVWVVLRPYPIRVAGPSGPLSGETSWDRLDLEPEHTTVTGKIRRVGQWDSDLARDAVQANGGPAPNVLVALMMWDQQCPSAAGQDSFYHLTDQQLGELDLWRLRIQYETGARLAVVGTGPRTVIWIPGHARYTKTRRDLDIMYRSLV